MSVYVQLRILKKKKKNLGKALKSLSNSRKKFLDLSQQTPMKHQGVEGRFLKATEDGWPGQ